ncbi:UNVERIFIED_CONTAM: hypothetical protein HDU68_005681, partial [Siphonaria sp. JEL0065]
NPEKRWTIVQARDHPWVTHGVILMDNGINQILKTRPKTETELDPDLIEQIQQMGFEKGTAIASILGGKFNQAAGTYYLMSAQKRNEIEKRNRIAREQQIHGTKAAAIAAANANAGSAPPRKKVDLESLRAQIETEKQRTRPGENNPALNDIILEYERRKSEVQNQDGEKSSSKGNLTSPNGWGGRQRGVAPPVNPKDQFPSKSSQVQNGILPAGIIGPGIVPIPGPHKGQAKNTNVDVGSALMQQQAAYLVPSTPPESKAAALSAGPLTDMLYATHNEYKGIQII